MAFCQVEFPKEVNCTNEGSLQFVMDREGLAHTTVEDVSFFIVLSDTAVVVNLCCVDLISENPEM